MGLPIDLKLQKYAKKNLIAQDRLKVIKVILEFNIHRN